MPFINIITKDDNLAARIRATFPEEVYKIETVESFAIAQKNLSQTDILIADCLEEEHYKIVRTLYDDINNHVWTIAIKDKFPEWEGMLPGYYIDFDVYQLRAFKQQELRSIVERMLNSPIVEDDRYSL